ncbi:MAG: putative acyl-CoA dehydrogenase, partial [Frankiales bacterium]|nr:putative acyl-CoA dehydrogenase [Frankiales bacterium]
MQHTLYEPEHDAFRGAVRSFLAKHVEPFHAEWEAAGIVDRSVWVEAGKQGLLGTDVPEQYGGGGIKDFRYNCVIGEELTRSGASGVGFTLHNDVMAPYLLDLTTDEQKARWLPSFVSGEMITAIAMSEPGAGSDLQGLKTTARRDGDDWVLSGSKTFITNGINADLVLVVARTDPDAGARGFSLLAVERGMKGFERGRNLAKVGLKAQDTAELFFDEVRVPGANLVGREGGGFVHLMEKLPQERLSIAVGAVASARRVFDLTLEYCKGRTAFGKPIGSFQHNRFVLAEMATELELAETYIEKAVTEHNAGRY